MRYEMKQVLQHKAAHEAQLYVALNDESVPMALDLGFSLACSFQGWEMRAGRRGQFRVVACGTPSQLQPIEIYLDALEADEIELTPFHMSPTASTI